MIKVERKESTDRSDSFAKGNFQKCIVLNEQKSWSTVDFRNYKKIAFSRTASWLILSKETLTHQSS